MKKLILALSLILFSLPAYGLDVYKSAKEKVTEFAQPSEESLTSKSKPSWEIGFRLGVLDNPAGGGYAFTAENYDAYLRHNLSKTLFAYTWAGFRNAVKDDMEGSVYKPKWDSQMLFAGFGVYLSREISIYASAGKIWLKNENSSEPSIDTAVERGISYDYPIGDNKLVTSYRFIDAKMTDQEDKHISEIQGDGSFSVVSIMFSVPIGN